MGSLVTFNPRMTTAAVLPVVAGHAHLVSLTRGDPAHLLNGLPNQPDDAHDGS
jgi:hypothetical protein